MIPTLTSTLRRPPARATWPLVLPIISASLLAAACSVGPDPGPTNEAPKGPGSSSHPAESSATTAPSRTSPTPGPVVGEVPITIAIADTVITARLADNATARDLLDQLPLTLRFRDFNHLEKIAKLPRPLTLDGAPAGADPDVDDIGYYAPSGDLVLYYGDVGYFDGIVRLGRFGDGDLAAIVRQPDGFEVTLERA